MECEAGSELSTSEREVSDIALHFQRTGKSILYLSSIESSRADKTGTRCLCLSERYAREFLFRRLVDGVGRYSDNLTL